MFVTGLTLTNFRAISEAELRFRQGMNLVVGVNGVGKTSVLDALAVCLSTVVKRTNKLRSRAAAFAAEDIRIGTDALTVECDFRHHQQEIRYLVHKPREASTPKGNGGLPREQVHETPDRAGFFRVDSDKPAILLVAGREIAPLGVLFSTNRAIPSRRKPSIQGGIAGAAANALSQRELGLGELAWWIRARRDLSGEDPAAARVLSACEEAVRYFLPGYRNLRPDGEQRPQLWIDQGATSIPVQHLSDGERGSLSLVLDLTRRLALANPHLDDPAQDAEAVVLIDEIDLHLHPKWQREIVHNLTRAFPRCQFIATTHSPQVIGEVPYDRIQIMSDGQVDRPMHSFGVDSSRVLEEVMGAEPRTREVHELLQELSRVIGHERFGQGRELLARLIEVVGDSDPEVTRTRTLLDFLEGVE